MGAAKSKKGTNESLVGEKEALFVLAKTSVRKGMKHAETGTSLPSSCRRMRREREGWVERNAQEFWVVDLRDDNAVERDRRKATELPIPRSEKGGGGFCRRKRKVVLFSLIREFRRRRLQVSGDVVWRDVT